jgi:leader peptidase (prepilin peptidase)/N-methyltransferase
MGSPREDSAQRAPTSQANLAVSWLMSTLIVTVAVVAADWIALNRWRRWEQQLLTESRSAQSSSSSVDQSDPLGHGSGQGLRNVAATTVGPTATEAEPDVWVSPGVPSGSRTKSVTTVASRTVATTTLDTRAAQATRSQIWSSSPRPRRLRWGLASVAAVLAAGATLSIGARPALLLYVYLGAVLLPLLMCDVRLHRLPTCFIAPAYPAAAVAFLADAVVTGEWSRLLHAVLGCAVLGGVYLVLCAMPGGLMGLGDVRLAGVLGAALVWVSWEALIVGALGAFALSFLIAVPQLLLRRTQLQSRVAFGPYMLIASALAVAVSA